MDGSGLWSEGHRSPSRESFTYKGECSREIPRLILVMKAEKIIKHGAWAFLASITKNNRANIDVSSVPVTTLNFHILRVATDVSCSSIMRKYNSFMNIIYNINFKKMLKTTSSLENAATVLRV